MRCPKRGLANVACKGQIGGGGVAEGAAELIDHQRLHLSAYALPQAHPRPSPSVCQLEQLLFVRECRLGQCQMASGWSSPRLSPLQVGCPHLLTAAREETCGLKIALLWCVMGMIWHG